MRHSARLRLNLCYDYYCVFHALYHLISVSSLSSRLVVFFFVVTPNYFVPLSLFAFAPSENEADLLTEISFQKTKNRRRDALFTSNSHSSSLNWTSSLSLSLSLIRSRCVSLFLSLSLSLFQAEENKSHLSLRLRLRAFFSTRGAQKRRESDTALNCAVEFRAEWSSIL